MWKAVSKNTGDAFYMLPEKENYTVGRQSSDLDIKNDSSISRNHANMMPSTDYVEVVDLGSKFNTYCNENIENKIPMEKNKSYKIKDGERVKFGQMHSEFIFTKMRIVTVPSTLNSNEKQALTQVMNAIKGQIENEVTPICTHLTMNGIIITIKLLHALLEGIPIVNIKFWNDYLESLRKGNKLPDPVNYIPDIAENFMNIKKEMLIFKEERKMLFRGKIFMFINKKTYDNYNLIITKAGGESKVLKNVPLSQLTNKNIIVIQYTSSTQSEEANNLMDTISEFLKKHSLRLIPDYEIGIALINCSIQKYCNTQYNIETEFFKENVKSGFTESSNSDIIAEETPHSNMRSGSKARSHLPEIVVPESIGSAVYDLTESDAEESEKINSENVAQNSQEDILNMIIDDDEEDKNLVKQKPKEDEKIVQKCADKLNEDSQNKRKREESPLKHTEQQNKKINLDTENGKNSVPENITESLSDDSVPKTKPKPLSGFLEKGLIRKEGEKSKQQQNIPSQSSSEISINQKKRGRFANLDSDDSDNDGDLFNFGGSKNKKTRTNSSDDEIHQIDDVDDDNLFNIRKRTNADKQTSPKTSQLDLTTSKISTDTTKSSNSNISKNATKQTYTNEWKKPDTPQEQISTSGWLSKQVIKMKIKDEEDVQEDVSTVNVDKTTNDKPDITIKSEDDSKWIKSLNGGFQVRVKPMQLVSKTSSLNILQDETNSNDSTANTTNGKNFKAFVNKRNFKSQKEVLTTVPFHVTGFSF